MGNASSTRTKVQNIVENHMEANSISTVKSECLQKIHVMAKGSKNTNCSLTKMVQKCNAMAEASAKVVMDALQAAENTKEVKQTVKNIPLGFNVSVINSDTLNKALSELETNCRSEIEQDLYQDQVVNMENTVNVCKPGQYLVSEMYQYGDPVATCIVDKIANFQQTAKDKTKVDQLIEGFDPMVLLGGCAASLCGVCILAAVLGLVGTMLSKNGKNSNNGGGGNSGGGGGNNGKKTSTDKALQRVVSRVAKTPSMKSAIALVGG